MFTEIYKRDGRLVPYDRSKIVVAVSKAMKACGRRVDESEPAHIGRLVEQMLEKNFGEVSPTVEQVQDVVELALIQQGYHFVAKHYIEYRAERTSRREQNSRLMKTLDEITFTDSSESDMKRDNANIDSNTAMGAMLKYGTETSKYYYLEKILPDEQAKAHKDGDIHIHDLDFYSLTMTCCQIDIIKLFNGGFSTGHGFLREPNDIASYAALTAIAIQANQNDQHGGQSIPNFDYALAIGVKKTYKKLYWSNIYKAISLLVDEQIQPKAVKDAYKKIEDETGLFPEMEPKPAFVTAEKYMLQQLVRNNPPIIEKIVAFARRESLAEVKKKTHQAMEGFVHNLNTMHSRAGAQVPFSSINYGTDTSPEGRLVIEKVLLATEEGLGNGETPIFPIQIFKVKEGVNYNPGDPNYDLFKLSMRVSAKRLFPNYSFLDAPFNLQYLKAGRPETEVAYMGCRTRVIGNVYDPSNEIVYGRGNISFTTINLPRIALNNNGNVERFFIELEQKMNLVTQQLLDRMRIVGKKRVYNFPFLMGQGIWLGSDKLGYTDTIEEVMKQGTLSMGFIGLAEALVSLVGKHHGEDERARNLGFEIISFMRDYVDRMSKRTGLNFTLLATPAEGLSGRFVNIDKKKFGSIPGVTDREFYTNSFHIPVYFPISAYDKIKLESPYHALTNAGHISYIEMDGDTAKNLDAFEKVIRCMKESNVGYGSINHPVDRDPVCGYHGIINDVCPNCGRREDEDEFGFERIRRITGYLVGTVERFNDAKRAEEKARVKHKID